jgi:hypothetical protein
VSFAAITLFAASQQVFIVVSVYFVMDPVRKLFDTTSYCGGDIGTSEKYMAAQCGAVFCYDRLLWLVKPKVKVKLSLCLTKHHAMKKYWGSGGIAPRILDLDTRWM